MQEPRIRVPRDAHRRSDREADADHEAPEDDQQRRRPVEHLECDLDPFVLPRSFELFGEGAARDRAGDPAQKRVTDDDADPAREDDVTERQLALRREGGGDVQDRLAREDRDDGVERDEGEDREIGALELDVEAADRLDQDRDDPEQQHKGERRRQDPARPGQADAQPPAESRSPLSVTASRASIATLRG